MDSVKPFLLDSSHSDDLPRVSYISILSQSPHFSSPLFVHGRCKAMFYVVSSSVSSVSSNHKSMWCFFLGYVFSCAGKSEGLNSSLSLSLYSTSSLHGEGRIICVLATFVCSFMWLSLSLSR
jgi:hypothetical protein